MLRFAFYTDYFKSREGVTSVQVTTINISSDTQITKCRSTNGSIWGYQTFCYANLLIPRSFTFLLSPLNWQDSIVKRITYYVVAVLLNQLFFSSAR